MKLHSRFTPPDFPANGANQPRASQQPGDPSARALESAPRPSLRKELSGTDPPKVRPRVVSEHGYPLDKPPLCRANGFDAGMCLAI